MSTKELDDWLRSGEYARLTSLRLFPETRGFRIPTFLNRRFTMSSTLSWYPQRVNGKALSTGLKFKLRHLYMEPVDTLLTDKSLPVLQALAIGMAGDPAMVKEVGDLIAGIEKYGTIVLKEEW